MSEIARFYGFKVSMDNSFKGNPSILIDYEEDHIKGRFDLAKEQFIDDDFPKSMQRIIFEWVEDHIQVLKAMWREKTIAELPEWE